MTDLETIIDEILPQTQIPPGYLSRAYLKEFLEALIQRGQFKLAVNVQDLHSKIDMDIEDVIGREITLEESRIIGIAIIKAIAHPLPSAVTGSNPVAHTIPPGTEAEAEALWNIIIEGFETHLEEEDCSPINKGQRLFLRIFFDYLEDRFNIIERTGT